MDTKVNVKEEINKVTTKSLEKGSVGRQSQMQKMPQYANKTPDMVGH